MQTIEKTAQSATLQKTAQPLHNQKIISTNRNNFDVAQHAKANNYADIKATPDATLQVTQSVAPFEKIIFDKQTPQRGDAENKRIYKQ